MDDFEKRLAFFRETDRMKYVLRRTYTGDASRRENDAEHSFSLILLAILFESYAPPGADPERVLRMAAVHDLVEIYAGDSYVYDQSAMDSKADRENAAAKRLFGLLPADQGAELEALWREFDAEETPSALFCAALDHFQPLFMNYETEGKSWIEHGVSAQSVRRRVKMIESAVPELYEYSLKLIQSALERGWLKE